jgi:hypothetical protein
VRSGFNLNEECLKTLRTEKSNYIASPERTFVASKASTIKKKKSFVRAHSTLASFLQRD